MKKKCHCCDSECTKWKSQIMIFNVFEWFCVYTKILFANVLLGYIATWTLNNTYCESRMFDSHTICSLTSSSILQFQQYKRTRNHHNKITYWLHGISIFVCDYFAWRKLSFILINRQLKQIITMDKRSLVEKSIIRFCFIHIECYNQKFDSFFCDDCGNLIRYVCLFVLFHFIKNYWIYDGCG